MINTRNKINYSSFVLIIMIITIFIQFMQQLNSIHTESCFIMLGVLLVHFIRARSVLTKNEWHVILFSIIFVLILFTYKILGISTADFDRFSGYLNWIIVIYCGIYAKNCFSFRQNKILFYSIFITGIISELILVYQAQSIANIYYRFSIIDNAAYGSMIMLYGGACLIYFLHIKRTGLKMASLIGYLLSAYLTVFVLQRTINFVLFSIMSALIIVLNQKNRKSAIRVFLVLLVILYFAIYNDLLVIILEKVAGQLEHRMATRINSIIIFLKSKNIDDAGGFSNRYYLLETTLNSWRSSFTSLIFGVGDHRATNDIIGNHNELIDMLARFGLLGASIVYFNFLFQYRLLEDYCRFFDYSLLTNVRIVFIIYLVRNFLGTAMTSQISSVMFIMLPLIGVVSECGNNMLLNNSS